MKIIRTVEFIRDYKKIIRNIGEEYSLVVNKTLIGSFKVIQPPKEVKIEKVYKFERFDNKGGYNEKKQIFQTRKAKNS